ncbi:putative methyltransferase-domain-containing protein [Epithele typhae]|uniref:putative methyltransferase-domain-containing protein n=1 Tax=Epithele typhae TaxID=378194 RepID=UPI002007354A|nr:putative methyltransferase-domain-containing protein [Epithele typhae]KAH9943016.1 putative methyltransferase-domain-containing protein [Epithele typhae]
MADLALEEKLDALDPLRHLREDDSDEDGAGIVAPQPPSIRNQSVELVFHTSHDTKTDVGPGAFTIALAVDASPGCGGIAWPAGEVLSAYIAHRGALEGKVVVELGSGTGLVGLVAGRLGAQVWITDQAPLLPIMHQNVALNNLQASVTVAELNWGEPLPAEIPRPDVILAADCVYFEPAFPLLVQTLAALVSDRSTEVLFCYKKRRKASLVLFFYRLDDYPRLLALRGTASQTITVGGSNADKRFFTLLKKEFTWEDVGDDPQRDVYTREAISLLYLFRK